MLLVILMVVFGLIFLGLTFRIAAFAFRVLFGLLFAGFIIFALFWLFSRVLLLF